MHSPSCVQFGSPQKGRESARGGLLSMRSNVIEKGRGERTEV